MGRLLLPDQMVVPSSSRDVEITPVRKAGATVNRSFCL